MQRFDIRLLRRALRVIQDREVFSAKDLAFALHSEPQFFELWVVCKYREDLKRELGKIKSRKASLLLTSKRLPLICQSRTFQTPCFSGGAIYHSGKISTLEASSLGG